MRSALTFFHSRTGRVLRYLVSIGFLGAFIVSVDWTRLDRIRDVFDTGTVVAAALFAGATFPLQAWRWWLLLRAQGVGRSFAWTHWVTWIGQFYNSFFVGGLGGDVARGYYACRDCPAAKAGGLASIALDRIMGLMVLVSLAVLALATKAGALADQAGLRIAFAAWLGLMAAAIATAGFLLAVEPARWPRALQRLLRPEGIAIATELRSRIRNNRAAHLLALAISHFIWLLDIVAIWLLARAVGMNLPLLETCIAVSVAYAATALPISVGGHGLREGTLLGVLGIFGLTATGAAEQDSGPLLAILVWAVTIFWSLAGGVVLLGAPRLLAREE